MINEMVLKIVKMSWMKYMLDLRTICRIQNMHNYIKIKINKYPK